MGKNKTEVIKARGQDINPEIEIDAKNLFFTSETANLFDFTQYDYIVDAIDMVTSKLLAAEMASAAHTPLVSCMGAGNKLDPAQFCVDDIYNTSVCPLARVMRCLLYTSRCV